MPSIVEQLRAAKAVDDGIRERHGLTCYGKPNTIWEDGDQIVLGGTSLDRHMTQWQARYLASKLYRLSRRIRDRAIADAEQAEVQS